MPHIQCIVRKGLTHKTRSLLAKALADAINREINAPIEYIYVTIKEIPSGQIIEAGKFRPTYGTVMSERRPVIKGER